MPVFVAHEDLFSDTVETRHLLVVGHPTLGTRRLSLNEFYCADPVCDCRLVRFEVVDGATEDREAVVTFLLDGGETPEGLNPYLEPGEDPGPDADLMRDLVDDAIRRDRLFEKRLQRHYDEVKQFFRTHPEHPLLETVLDDNKAMEAIFRTVVNSAPDGPRNLARETRNKRKAQRRARRGKG